jgi:hypothetical protein
VLAHCFFLPTVPGTANCGAGAACTACLVLCMWSQGVCVCQFNVKFAWIGCQVDLGRVLSSNECELHWLEALGSPSLALATA